MCLLFLHHELRVLSDVGGSVGKHGTLSLEFLDPKHYRDKVLLFFLEEKCHGLFLLSVNLHFPPVPLQAFV